MKIGGHDVELSNPGKVLFPDSGRTKGDLIEYYYRIGETMLPHVKDRPLTLHRFPEGIDADGFYQKNASDYFPEWIERVRLGKEIKNELVLCQDMATLIYLANQAVITPHVWLSRYDKPECPDRLVFDLDPGDGNFDVVRKAAMMVCDLLTEIGMTCFAMTTGSRGLHVVVPLDRRSDFSAVRSFAREVAELVAMRAPDLFTTEHRKNKRGGRLFIDTTRNAYGQTTVAPYAVRAKPGAPVATPLEWEEVGDAKLRSNRYHIKNIFRRLGQKPDPWATIDEQPAHLARYQQRLDRLHRRSMRRRA